MEGDVVGRSGETLEEEEEEVLRRSSGSTGLLMVAVVDCLSRWLSYEDELLVGNLILGIMFVVVGAVEEFCCGRSGPVLPFLCCILVPTQKSHFNKTEEKRKPGKFFFQYSRYYGSIARVFQVLYCYLPYRILYIFLNHQVVWYWYYICYLY